MPNSQTDWPKAVAEWFWARPRVWIPSIVLVVWLVVLPLSDGGSSADLVQAILGNLWVLIGFVVVVGTVLGLLCWLIPPLRKPVGWLFKGPVDQGKWWFKGPEFDPTFDRADRREIQREFCRPWDAACRSSGECTTRTDKRGKDHQFGHRIECVEHDLRGPLLHIRPRPETGPADVVAALPVLGAAMGERLVDDGPSTRRHGWVRVLVERADPLDVRVEAHDTSDDEFGGGAIWS